LVVEFHLLQSYPIPSEPFHHSKVNRKINMPLPSDEALVASAQDVLGKLKGAFGPHPGFRPAHAKGVLLSGTFTPSEIASTLSSAPHFTAASTPVLARFSDSTGIPQIPDNDGNSKPNGLAIRFVLPNDPVTGHRKHTDIVGHSTPHFPVQTGEQFGEFLTALGGGPEATGKFISEHPSTARFVTAPKPYTKSYASHEYYYLHTFGLTKDGKETWLKYTVTPAGGIETITDEEATALGPEYLHNEILERVKKGPIELKIVGTIANEGDVKNDITEEWEGEHKTVELGTVKLTATVEDDAVVQKNTIFDPIPRVEGITEPEGDKILEFRAALYLLSGRERRAA